MSDYKFKSKAEVLKEHPEYKTLINAVYSELGGEKEEVENELSNIYIGGMEAGIGNFIYYSDTHKFAMKHRKSIIDLLEETADGMGEEVTEMVSNFGVFRRSGIDKEDKKDLYMYLGGGKPKQGTITNIMCWFAVEEVARWFEKW